jgi:hypothetical protein
MEARHAEAAGPFCARERERDQNRARALTYSKTPPEAAKNIVEIGQRQIRAQSDEESLADVEKVVPL